MEKSSLDEGVDVVEDDVMWSFPLIMARGIVSKCNLDLLSHEHYYCEKGNKNVFKWCYFYYFQTSNDVNHGYD